MTGGVHANASVNQRLLQSPLVLAMTCHDTTHSNRTSHLRPRTRVNPHRQYLENFSSIMNACSIASHDVIVTVVTDAPSDAPRYLIP